MAIALISLYSIKQAQCIFNLPGWYSFWSVSSFCLLIWSLLLLDKANPVLVWAELILVITWCWIKVHYLQPCSGQGRGTSACCHHQSWGHYGAGETISWHVKMCFSSAEEYPKAQSYGSSDPKLLSTSTAADGAWSCGWDLHMYLISVAGSSFN